MNLLASESIDKMRALGLDVNSGDFTENITTIGIDLVRLPVGSRLPIGNTLLEVTQIGKECHTRCAIFFRPVTASCLRKGFLKGDLEAALSKREIPLSQL